MITTTRMQIIITTWLVVTLSLPASTPYADVIDKITIRKLSSVVSACVNRSDTNYPVFHGCIDWHSSVHGHWALLWAAYRLDDPDLAQSIIKKLNADGLNREFSDFKQRDLIKTYFEMPYGRAWFLQLARDAEGLYGVKTLRPFATYLFKTLLEFARRGGGDVTATDYENASWYLFQLLEWSKFTCDSQAADEITQIIRERLHGQPSLPEFRNIRGFFDPRSLAALALAATEIREADLQNIKQLFTNDPLIPHQYPFQTAHQGGLNYSRLWGLFVLYKITGDEKVRDVISDHLESMSSTFDAWASDYYRFGHWVPQFGLFADRIRFEMEESNRFLEQCH